MLLCVSFLVCAQGITDDIRKLNAKMRERRFSYKVTYSMYDAHQGGRLMETQPMEYHVWDGMLSVKTRLFHVIKNKKHYLYVDLSRKAMMLNPVDNYKEEMKQAEALNGLVNLDSLTGTLVRSQLLSETGGIRTYRFFYPDKMPFLYSDLTFDPGDQTVKKAVMFYRKSLSDLLGKDNEQASANRPRIEMVFNAFTYETAPNERNFSIATYVTRSGKQFKPLPLYSNYQFINHTPEKK